MLKENIHCKDYPKSIKNRLEKRSGIYPKTLLGLAFRFQVIHQNYLLNGHLKATSKCIT